MIVKCGHSFGLNQYLQESVEQIRDAMCDLPEQPAAIFWDHECFARPLPRFDMESWSERYLDYSASNLKRLAFPVHFASIACPRHSTGMSLNGVSQNEMTRWPSYLVQSKELNSQHCRLQLSAQSDWLHAPLLALKARRQVSPRWLGRMQRGILLFLYGSRLIFWSTCSECMLDVLCVGRCTLNQCYWHAS